MEGVPSAEEVRREQIASTNRFIEAAHQGPEIRRVSGRMKEFRIRNGYEDMIYDAMELKQRETR